MTRPLQALAFTTLLILSFVSGATAQERLCDTQYEDCRWPILQLIRQETQGIDLAFWFMEDARYITELVKRHQAGVPVRVLVDSRANASKRHNETILNLLRDAGIPMREKYTGGDILHFKMFLFHGQNVVEFSKANFTDTSFVPLVPNVNFFDEAIFFTDDTNLTNTFRRRFDDLWTNTTMYRDYANITTPPARRYPLYPIHSSMNFPPIQNFSDRALSRYDREMRAIDAIVYRVTDHRQANAMLRAVARGAPVRLITEPDEYRNPKRLWHAKHVDRMYIGGVQMKHRRHEGLMHQGSVVLHGLGEVIFGSSNWTTASAIYQDEHNYFYDPSLGKPWFFQWFADQFERKWNDTTNYVPFQPLPPDAPIYSSPANGASGIGSSVTLTWDGGPWGHLYDIYVGTDPLNLQLIAGNQELGSPLADQVEKFTVTNLQQGTTYYWRIVGKTWAQLAKGGATWWFTTAGTAPAGGGSGSTPFSGTPASIPGTFQAENFDNGGQAVAYFDTDAGNAGGVYRSTDVDLQAATDTGGGYLIGWTKAGEWLKYTVNVATTGTYTLEARVANIGTGASFRVEVDGVDRTGPIAVPDTGGWQSWRTISVGGIPLSAGQRVIRVAFTAVTASRGAAGNYNWFRLAQGTSTETPSSSSTPFGGTAAALPGIVQTENFDEGGQGLAYHDASSGNSGGAYRSTDVDVGATADPLSGGHFLGWARVGEWVKYTVNVTATRTYAMSVRVANLGSGATFRIEVDGVDRTGPISVPNTGGWDTWQTIPVPISLTQGQCVIRLVMLTPNAENTSVGNFGYFLFE